MQGERHAGCPGTAGTEKFCRDEGEIVDAITFVCHEADTRGVSADRHSSGIQSVNSDASAQRWMQKVGIEDDFPKCRLGSYECHIYTAHSSLLFSTLVFTSQIADSP